MVEEGPYEIMPYKDIMQLKRDIEDLKKKTQDVTAQDLVNGMNRLAGSMGDLTQLFKAASEELKEESKREHEIAENLKVMIDKLNEALDENKVIADGVLAVSDNVNEKFKMINERLDKMHFQTTVTRRRTEFTEPVKPKIEDKPVQQPQSQTSTVSYTEPFLIPSSSSPFDAPQFGQQPQPPLNPPMNKPQFQPYQQPPYPQNQPFQSSMPPAPPLTDNFDDLFPEEPKKKGLLGRMFKK